MTKKENHLFCRIAVHNKLVALQDANAFLREAVASEGDVGDLLVEEGLLTQEQAATIRRAVQRRSQGGQAEPGERPARAPASRRESGPRRRRERRTRPQNTSQLVLTISSFVVILVVVVVFVLVWGGSQSQDEFVAGKETTSGSAGGAAAGGPPAARAPSQPLSPPETARTTPPVLSEEQKQEIEDACNKAIGDAMMAVTEQVGKGVASLDNFLKLYGDRATPDQKSRIMGKRDQLVAIIKRKFAKDKERLLEAKRNGDAGEVIRIANDIKYYADADTAKEVEELLAAGT